MALPVPQLGLVIHFNYLGKREEQQGSDNARYPRPAVIVLAFTRGEDGAQVVVVAPVTHAPPRPGTDAIEMPAQVKRKLSLDGERSWVVVDEVNMFVWPGFDLQANKAGEIADGLVPSRFYEQIRQRVLANAQSGRLGRTHR